MLSLMRKHAQSWIIKIALFAVAIVFVFWGVGSFRSERATRVATVNGKTISQNEFQQAYQQYLGRLQDTGGGRLDDKMLKELKVKQRVMDSLIDQRLLTQLGKDLGFSVTRDELISKIQQIPAFQENGRFSPSRYQRLLQMQRINVEAFEAEQTEQIMMERIQNFMSNFIKVDPEEVRNFYAYLSDEINLALIRFDPEAYRKKLQPTPEQLQAFFAKNPNRYQTPAQVRVGFIEVAPVALEGSAAVPEKELQSYYQQNNQKFLDPKNNQPLPFEQVKDKIQQQLVRERAREAAHQKAEDIYDQLLMIGNLKTFGAKNRVPVQETGWLTYGQPGGAGPEQEKAFLDKAFALKKGEISTVQEFGPDRGFFILQVTERKEARPMSFAEAESRVQQDWLEEQAGLMAQAEAEKFLKEARSAGDWRKLAQEKNLSIEESGYFSRFKNLPAWAQTPENAQIIFSVGTGTPLPEKVLKAGSAYLFLAFKDYRKAAAEEFSQQQDRLAQVLRQQKGSRLLEEWLQQLRKKANIKIYQEG
ncbi:MAG: SurA N-terminal domain-containing protein [Deltaproteobacteria bacterium]|nr:SurA N-terminal domain-containing protein [Deltaproteobacteria bacterium]